MQRHRTVAGSPARSAADAWAVVTALVADTLDRSPDIDRAEVESAMGAAGGVGRALIAGGHLRASPLVVVAADMWLEIGTVSGMEALDLEEKLEAVPGAATASAWRVHLPQREPLAKEVREAAKAHANLSADEPQALEEAVAASAVTSDVLDLEALAQRTREGR